MCPVLVINVLLTLLLVWLWIKATMKACDIVKAERKAEKEKERLKNTQVSDQGELEQEDDGGKGGETAVQRSSALTATVVSKGDQVLAGNKDDYGLPVLPTGNAENDNEILELRSLIK